MGVTTAGMVGPSVLDLLRLSEPLEGDTAKETAFVDEGMWTDSTSLSHPLESDPKRRDNMCATKRKSGGSQQSRTGGNKAEKEDEVKLRKAAPALGTSMPKWGEKAMLT